MIRPAIFLDRDGVINAAIMRNNKPYAPQNLTELKILPKVIEALTALKQAGFLLIIITNQPDIARGKLQKTAVEEMHKFLSAKLPIDDIFTCYHDNQDNCDCRKPLPGLIVAAAKKYTINLAASFMVGDRYKDIAAGKVAGCKTIWINNNYSEPKPLTADYVTNSLFDALPLILKNRQSI